MRAHVVVVDYGVGNLLSVTRALAECGADVKLTGEPGAIAAADRVILPGVGAFGQCIDRVRERGLEVALQDIVSRGRPLLGICVGMQMLLSRSEEFGEHFGLNFIPGTVQRVPRTVIGNRVRKVPHIGWFPLNPSAARESEGWQRSPLSGVPVGASMYFLHSFEARPTEPANVLATYRATDAAICAAVAKENVFGVQFHPEKSGTAGLAVLKSFLAI